MNILSLSCLPDIASDPGHEKCQCGVRECASRSKGLDCNDLARHETQGRFSVLEEKKGFTLVELLAVIAVILIMTALVVPIFTSMRGAGDVTSASYNVSGVLEAARSYAMANNTYTWVGFYEENTTDLLATANKPPYPGKGKLLLAIVYSKDGTNIFSSTDPAATLPATGIGQIGKIVKVENIHLLDLGKPVGSANTNSLDGRPDGPFTFNASSDDHWNRISSDSADYARFPFVAQGYTFQKTIMFTPRGEMNITGAFGKYTIVPLVELGLQATHGDTPDTASKNLVAIQMSGIAGNVRIYRP